MKVKEGILEPGVSSLGSLARTIVERVNPEAYAEYQLRQAIHDALQLIGKQRTAAIFEEEAA